MKIVVVGPGALGSLFYSLFRSQSSHDLFLLDHNPTRVKFLREHGITFVQAGTAQQLPLSITSCPEEIGPSDAILLCVKSSAVEGCLPSLPPLFHDRSLLVAFQNGISHLDALQRTPFLQEHYAIGVTSEGATLQSEGVVLHGGKGLTRIGFSAAAPLSVASTLEALVTAMNLAGLETILVNDITVPVWNKLLVNVGINALTVIYDCPNGMLLEIEEARLKMAAAVREAAAVARLKKIPITADPVSLTEEVCRATAGNISSMLQDVRKGRPTEISAINGAIIREASALGVPVPINAELVRRVKEIAGGF